MSTSKIVEYYSQWVRSNPFGTLDPAAKAALDPLRRKATPYTAKLSALRNNAQSQSCGALARVAPLAIWTSSLKSPELIYKAIKADVELTHSNRIVQDSVFIYTMAIRYLLHEPEDCAREQKAY